MGSTFKLQLVFSVLTLLAVNPTYSAEYQFFNDNEFINGFKTRPVNPSITTTGILKPVTAIAPPRWSLAEWYTKSLLAITEPKVSGSLSTWSNRYKRVTVGPNYLELAANSDEEWGQTYRTSSSQMWPHLLIVQNLYRPKINPYKTIPLVKMSSLRLSMNVELAYAKHIKDVAAGYNPSIQAAQFLMYFTLQNRNPLHPNYLEYIWFGLPIYDDRYDFVSGGTKFDPGTGKYIYRLDAKTFMPTSLHNTPSVNINIDLAPLMKSKLQEAIAAGALQNANLNDYYIGSSNMGWELSARSIVTMRVRNLSLIMRD